MDNLPPNPTREQVDNEKAFWMVMIGSLEPDSFDFATNKAEYEAHLAELDRYIFEHFSSPRPRTPAELISNATHDLPSRFREPIDWPNSWNNAANGSFGEAEDAPSPFTDSDNQAGNDRKRIRRESTANDDIRGRLDKAPRRINHSSATSSSSTLPLPHSQSSGRADFLARMKAQQEAAERRFRLEQADREMALALAQQTTEPYSANDQSTTDAFNRIFSPSQPPQTPVPVASQPSFQVQPERTRPVSNATFNENNDDDFEEISSLPASYAGLMPNRRTTQVIPSRPDTNYDGGWGFPAQTLESSEDSRDSSDSDVAFVSSRPINHHPGISYNGSGFSQMPGAFPISNTYAGAGQSVYNSRMDLPGAIRPTGQYVGYQPASQVGNPWMAQSRGQTFDLDEMIRERGLQGLGADTTRTREDLENLLMNIRPDEDLPAELRAGTPEEMRVPLMEHQKLGLTWLQKQEEGTNKGGILADDMGLGKTIQALALILTRRSTDPARRATLIVAPVALMRQWQREIEQKTRPQNRLKTVIFHGQSKRMTFNQLNSHDVVLTTYGTLASELKRKETFERRKLANPQAQPTERDRLSLLGDSCLWHRVILDEAQCIKNRTTKTARASWHLNSTYRLCMTGTPMMNNVGELYSLIHFLRISPYNVWEHFNSDFIRGLKSYDERQNRKVMQRLQALLKSILLRRTKKSKIDDRPILSLPERTTESALAVFDRDQSEFYKSLEQNTQLRVNKYLKAGTIGKNYSNILVLLLRLRQACCHPGLIENHGVPEGADISVSEMEQLAHNYKPDVVARIKEADSAFECPICYDGTDNPTLFFPCGHDVCPECFTRMTDPAFAMANGEDRVEAKCPECRGKVDPKQVISYTVFQKVHEPEKYREQFGGGDGGPSDPAEDETTDDSDDEDDDDDDVNSQGDLDGFVVRDDEEDDADGEDEDVEVKSEQGNAVDDEAAEGSRTASSSKKKTKGKSKRSSFKGKDKAPMKKKMTLAELKRLGSRNAKAKDKYLKRLAKDWVTSTKIEKTMEILRQVGDNDPTEKTIIFSQFTTFLDFMEVPIRDAGYRYKRYDGSMSPAQRAEAVEEFMDKPEVRVILVSLKAGNAGLNLNIASQVILLDPFWNPFIEEQAIDRAHRIGQVRPVRVHRVLVAGTVEDRIIKLQEQKRELINEALDEGASRSLSRLGVRELRFLFGLGGS